MPLAMLLITFAMDGICCACVTYSAVKSCLGCGDRERAPDREGCSCSVFWSCRVPRVQVEGDACESVGAKSGP